MIDNFSDKATLWGTGFVSFTVGSLLTWRLRRRIENFGILHRTVTKNPDSLESKMVLVVRTDLNMKPGKVASQCAHAAVACYRNSLQIAPDLTKLWVFRGQPKIVVRCYSETDFYTLQSKASERKLVCAVVQDAGRTEVISGTKTVLGIGPGSKKDVDEITKHLKLY